MKSLRQIAQECADLANKTSGEGCTFPDGEAFRTLIDEAAAHQKCRDQEWCRRLQQTCAERDDWQREAKLMRQQFEELGGHTAKMYRALLERIAKYPENLNSDSQLRADLRSLLNLQDTGEPTPDNDRARTDYLLKNLRYFGKKVGDGNDVAYLCVEVPLKQFVLDGLVPAIDAARQAAAKGRAP